MRVTHAVGQEITPSGQRVEVTIEDEGKIVGRQEFIFGWTNDWTFEQGIENAVKTGNVRYLVRRASSGAILPVPQVALCELESAQKLLDGKGDRDDIRAIVSSLNRLHGVLDRLPQQIDNALGEHNAHWFPDCEPPAQTNQ